MSNGSIIVVCGAGIIGVLGLFIGAPLWATWVFVVVWAVLFSMMTDYELLR